MSYQKRSGAGGYQRRGNMGETRTTFHPHSKTIERRSSNGRGSSGHTPIYVGKTAVGHVAGGVFQKSVKASKHFLRRPRAIAFDINTLKDAEAAGARRVEVTDTESGRVYQLPLSTVWAKGWEFDRGHGRQWGVKLEDWLRPGERETVQPSLFGGAL